MTQHPPGKTSNQSVVESVRLDTKIGERIMSTATMNLHEVIEKLPPASTLILHDIGWAEYEDLVDGVGEAKGLRISYDQGTLQITTLSSKHEKYARLLERLVDLLSITLRIRVLFYGSVTIRKQARLKGAEPDGCFYVQHAELVGKKEELDFSSDPPPDIVIEVDLQHDSLSKFAIYAALGVPEIWRYDGQSLTIYHLAEDQYITAAASQALPMLTSSTLTEFLSRSQHED